MQRLKEYGLTDEQVAELQQTGQPQSRLTIYAPQSGTVIEKLAVEGSYVKAGDPIYRIAELSTVWLMLALFPEDASRIRFGQRVEAVVQSLPGETFVGRVAFIDPTVNSKTRTVGVRVELLNEQGRLRPGDYAEAQIALPIGARGQIYDADLAGKWISPMHPQIIREEPGQCPICGMDLVPTANYGFAGEPVPQPESLFVPRSAVLMAGGNSVVYVETEPGRFEIRPVTVGQILRDKIVILDGLKVGDQVATAGNFLIDSQMQLAGKPSLIDPTRAIAKAKERKGPLVFEQIAVQNIGGTAGKQLEELYAAYFAVQQALAADKTPPARRGPDAPSCGCRFGQRHDARLRRSSSDCTRSRPTPSICTIRTWPLLGSRSSRSAMPWWRLPPQVRSETADQPFTHFFCPMVKGGGGDWLQPGGELLNPYYGSEMLHCGEKVQEFPPRGAAVPEANPTAPPPSTAPPDAAPQASAASKGV